MALLLALAPGAAPASAAVARGAAVTVEEFLQSLSTVPGVAERRDPFQQLPPPFASSSDMSAGPVSEDAPPLERHSLTDYEVVAVLIGDRYPRALVRLPKEGTGPQKVVILKEKDRIGNRKGLVARITKTGVFVREGQQQKPGSVDRTEVLLKVGGSATDQKRDLVMDGKAAKGAGK